jgi:hypothetical protein
MKSVIAVMSFTSIAQAAVESVAPSASSHSSSISFDGLATSTEANSLVVGGLSFGVIVARVSANATSSWTLVPASPVTLTRRIPFRVANLADLVLTVDLPRSPGPPTTSK